MIGHLRPTEKIIFSLQGAVVANCSRRASVTCPNYETTVFTEDCRTALCAKASERTRRSKISHFWIVFSGASIKAWEAGFSIQDMYLWSRAPYTEHCSVSSLHNCLKQSGGNTQTLQKANETAPGAVISRVSFSKSRYEIVMICLVSSVVYSAQPIL